MSTKESETKQKLEAHSQLKRAFFKTVQSGDVEEVRKLIEKGCDITWKDVGDDDSSSDCSTGATALHYACEKGHIALVSFILNLNQNIIDEYDSSLWTPLHYAIDGGHSTVIEILVQKGADILKPGMCGGNEPPGTPRTNLKITPFHMAAGQNARNPGIYQMLSKVLSSRKVDFSTIPPDILGRTPLDCIKNPSKQHQDMKKEVEASLIPNQTAPWETQSGFSLFQDTPGTPTMSGTSPTLSFSSTSSSSSLSFLAFSNSSIHPVKPLDKITDSHDSSSNIVPDKESTKIFEKKEKTEMSRLHQPQDIRPFLEKCRVEGDGDNLPESGVAFRRAAAAGLEEITRALAENDKTLDINQPEAESGQTALHFAVIKGKTNIVSQLIGMRARQDIPDAQGKTAFDYAESADEGIKKFFAVKH